MRRATFKMSLIYINVNRGVRRYGLSLWTVAMNCRYGLLLISRNRGHENSHFVGWFTYRLQFFQYLQNQQQTLPEFTSMPTKQWLQVEVANDIVFTVIFHIQTRLQTIVRVSIIQHNLCFNPSISHISINCAVYTIVDFASCISLPALNEYKSKLNNLALLHCCRLR